MSELKTDQSAPDFTLPDQSSKPVSLKDFKSKWFVIYFYPKDNTPGCTIEAIDFTKYLKEFQKLGAVVLGVSPDSTESHCKFIEIQGLKIILLSDPEHKVLEKYGVWKLKSMYGKQYWGVYRSTFLINPEGKIAHVWYGVKPIGHAEEVLKKVKELSSK